MKKTIGWVLCLALAVLPAAGCSGASPGQTPEHNSNTLAPAARADGRVIISSEPMTLTLWDIATDGPTKDAHEGAVERFMADYPNVTVNITHTQNDNYKAKLADAMNTGRCPDIYMHWGGGPMIEYIESGFAADITDLFGSYNTIDFLPSAIEQCKYNGRVYAIPFGGIGGCGIFYNKAIFKKVGIKVPSAISELEAACDALLAAGYTPFSLANGSKWTGSMYFMYLASRYGGTQAFAAAVDGSGSFTDDAFTYAGETIQEWVRRGYFPEGVNQLSTDVGDDSQLMYQESAAMILHGSWLARSMEAERPDWYKANIGYFAFPALENSGYDQNIVVGTSIGYGFSFNLAGQEEKLKAAYVLATQYYNDAVYMEDQLRSNIIPSVVGMGDTIEDACMQEIWADFSAAPEVQLWYDQYLPPEVAERHKDLCHDLFGLTLTAQQANRALQDAMDAYNA